jgi:hypothetical protein
MGTFAAKLRETGHVIAKKGNLLVTRTRAAGETFFGEVAEAGEDAVGALRAEARAWKRFFGHRGVRLRTGATELFTPKALERELLARADGTLRYLDAQVRRRLVTLNGRGARGAKGARRKAAGQRARAANGPGRRSQAAGTGASASVAH